MRYRVTVIGAAVLAAGVAFASGSAAQSLSKTFDSYCLSNVSSSAVEPKARTDGFVALPPRFEKEFRLGMAEAGPLSGLTSLWKVTDGHVYLVMAGKLKAGPENPLGTDVDGNFCVTIASPMEAAADAELESLLGVGRVKPDKDGDKIYTFEQRESRRVAVDEKAVLGMARMISAGTLRVVMSNSDKEDDMSMFVVMAPVGKGRSALNEPRQAPSGNDGPSGPQSR